MIGEIKPGDGQVSPHDMHSHCLIVLLLDVYVHTCAVHAHAYMHIHRQSTYVCIHTLHMLTSHSR